MRPVLLAALVAAALLLLRAFTGFLAATPAIEVATAWVITAALGISAVGFAKTGGSGWCGACAALAVLFNPLLPAAIPDTWMTPIEAGAAAICLAAVIRHWK